MLLDQYIPHYQFNMLHSLRVHAPIERVYQAFKDLRQEEISPLVEILSYIRELPSRMVGKNIPKAADDRPFIEQMMNGDFFILADDPPHEFVFGFVGKFWVLTDEAFVRLASPEEFIGYNDPENAKSAVNFLFVQEADGSVRISSETRIDVPGSAARRKFALYWSVVSIGVVLIRICLLQAIKRRAERTMSNAAGCLV